MDKYRVTLTDEERAELGQMVSSGKAAARKLTHARILLLADDALGEEYSDEQIVAALGTSPRTVSRVRQQQVTAGMDFALRRRRQPPRPDKVKIKEDVEHGSSSWPAVTRPKAVATGRSNCWPTNWSSSAWWTGSASRRYGRR